MPRIFDNIELSLLPALRETLNLSDRADFCVGYFNLRGWKQIDGFIDRWSGGPGHCCRLMVGMQRMPQDDLRRALSAKGVEEIDNQTALRLKKQLAEEFKNQLTIGVPNNADEAGLRRLAAQIRGNKVQVKLFLRHPLHAKLYLLFRPNDPNNPTTGFVGSSNLTFAGLANQGELNVDVLEHDACNKLAKWFEDRWADKWCIDISSELEQIINESWAREETLSPYLIYLKMAFHLSQEARAGLAEFHIPADFGNLLFDFQIAAVKIAAHHINKRNGVVIGDVVGLGKTLMATALARILEDDQCIETLVICPKNLVPMWEDYRIRYRLRATVIPISQVQRRLPDLPRHRLVLIDESHNLRNREAKSYRVIEDYIDRNDSRVMLLSATPYNKSYADLANQLRLFVPAESDIGIRPEHKLREMGETEFLRKHQCPLRSLAAFEKSEYADDWRELMRLYLVRRTRTFIQENYAETDSANGRKYLTFADGRRQYFPKRIPKRLKFTVRPSDSYAQLFSDDVVDTIDHLTLPRYGLGNYLAPAPRSPPTDAENKAINNLSRAGTRLKGFCRTNLFKRLESSGHSFLLSVERHVLRNFIYLHAIEQDQPLPIGPLETTLLDLRSVDDEDNLYRTDEDDDQGSGGVSAIQHPRTEQQFKALAADVYAEYSGPMLRRFKWLRAGLFIKQLKDDLIADARALMKILEDAGAWIPADDEKLTALIDLVRSKHPHDKVLVFTQFADTVDYLAAQLKAAKIPATNGVTGDSPDPTAIAWRFSPVSNDKRAGVAPADELRVLVATDVLSEGQNLQDCSIVVNYDLPWAIIRLIQRAGRVDRIGQQASEILCYTCLPAEGVERIIRLRSRLRTRLKQNAEVVGTDEAFFEDDVADQTIRDLFTEKSGILDGEVDSEVDLASRAYQIWKNAIEANPELEKVVESLPNVVYSTKKHSSTPAQPEGVLLYIRTGDGNDALAWLNRQGEAVSESQLEILKAAACDAATPAIPRFDDHHEIVAKGVELLATEQPSAGGQLGKPSGARFRTYERLKRFVQDASGTLLGHSDLLEHARRAIDEIYKFPLLQSAVDALNRQLKTGIADHELAKLVVMLRDEGRLCRVTEDQESGEPQIICSMGLRGS